MSALGAPATLTPRSGHDSISAVCRIAQLEERLTLDQEVLGSNPSPAANS